MNENQTEFRTAAEAVADIIGGPTTTTAGASPISSSPPPFVASAGASVVGGSEPTSKRKYRRKTQAQGVQPNVPTPLSPEDAELSFRVYSRLGEMGARFATDLVAVRIGNAASAIGPGKRQEFEELVTPAKSEIEMFGQCCGELAKLYNLHPKHGPLSGLFVLVAGYSVSVARVSQEIKTQLAEKAKIERLQKDAK